MNPGFCSASTGNILHLFKGTEPQEMTPEALSKVIPDEAWMWSLMFASLEMCNHRFKGDTTVENVRRDGDIGWNKRSRKKDLEKNWEVWIKMWNSKDPKDTNALTQSSWENRGSAFNSPAFPKQRSEPLPWHYRQTSRPGPSLSSSSQHPV